MVATDYKREEKTPLLQPNGAGNGWKSVHGKTSFLLPCNSNKYIFKEVSNGDLLASGEKSDTTIITKSQTSKDIVIDIENNYKKTTNLQTLMHLLKGLIGTGIMAMPAAFKNGGIWFGFAALFTIGLICTHCMHQLVNCSLLLCKRVEPTSLQYGEVAETCIKTGPSKLRKFSTAARRIVDVIQIFVQIGCCSVYLVFVAENIKQVVDHVQPDNLSESLYLVIITVLCTIYSLVRDLKTLAPFSAFANCLHFIGLVIVLGNLLTDLHDVSSRAAIASINTLPLAFGQIVFTFEGIPLILPLHNNMKENVAFRGWTGVLTVGLVIVICVNEAVGFYGYLKYGDETLGSVTLNLPTDQWLYLSLKALFSVSVFITYGLQFYVPVKLIWIGIAERLSSRKALAYGEYILRIVLVLVTFLLALVVPNLELLIGLIGATGGTALTLIFPPILEMLTLSVEEQGLTKWVILKDAAILVIGIIGSVTGTYSSLGSIIESFSDEGLNSTLD